MIVIVPLGLVITPRRRVLRVEFGESCVNCRVGGHVVRLQYVASMVDDTRVQWYVSRVEGYDDVVIGAESSYGRFLGLTFR